MKLITKAIKQNMPALGSQEKNSNPWIVAKFFTPWTNWTWYVVEGEVDASGDILFFGLVDGSTKELGYFTLHELLEVTGPHGFKVERDRYFVPQPLKNFTVNDSGE